MNFSTGRLRSITNDASEAASRERPLAWEMRQKRGAVLMDAMPVHGRGTQR